MTRNPSTMQAADIVAEIQQIRAALDDSARRLAELSQALHRMARRHPVSDSTSPYITYANAWGRFANVVGLGLRRTAVSDRVLAMVKTETEAEEAQEKEPPEKEPPEKEPRPVAQDEDFDVLYGEVLNAQ